MDGTRNIKVTSLVNGNVGVNLPNLHFSREWNTKGQIVTIPYDVLEEAMYDQGFQNMIKAGVLYIEDLESAKSFGLEDEEAKEPVKYKKYTEMEIKNLITKASFEEFKEDFEKMPKEQKIELRDWAITLRMRDDQKVQILEDYFKFNIDESIKLDRQRQEG